MTAIVEGNPAAVAARIIPGTPRPAGASVWRTALDAVLDRGMGTRGCCLTFHRVARHADWEGLLDQGFTLDIDRLDHLIGRLLRAGWDIVTIDEALRREPGSRRFVNFSIDDAYRDTWELAVPVFRKHGVPVTIYVTTGIPDGGYVLCYAGLEAILMECAEVVVPGEASRVALPDLATKRAAFVRLCQTWQAADPTACYLAFCTANGFDPEAMHERHAISWDMLESLRDDPCVEIGAHTVTHPRVSALSAESALAELTGCRVRIEERLGIPVRHFAFPYGRRGDCGPRDFALARQSGFASAATTRKGLILPNRPLSPYELPRNTLNGMRDDAWTMAAHLSGLSGAAARIMSRD